MKLGTLKKVENLRSIWDHEATNFTRWLAKSENIQLLSDEIGITLKVLQIEASVGNFAVDILAEEAETGKKIIIENQLEKTNHDHLGKIITYAAGHEAEIIIWIVKDFRDEHKQALDWLNEHTDDKINFFGINIELWQIDESAIAPKFNLISEPNKWTKALRVATAKGDLSENSTKLISFLDGFVSYCKEQGTVLHLGRVQAATPAYYTIGIKTNEGWIAVKLNNSKKTAKVDYYFKEKEPYQKFKLKYEKKVDALFDSALIWDDMDKYKGATVGVSGAFDLDKPETWKSYYAWIKQNAEIIQSNFPHLIATCGSVN